MGGEASLWLVLELVVSGELVVLAFAEAFGQRAIADKLLRRNVPLVHTSPSLRIETQQFQHSTTFTSRHKMVEKHMI